MTAKTKQEALCCQDLSVRCAKAELELETLKDWRRANLAIMAAVGERESRSVETIKQLSDEHRLLTEENKRLKNERWRVHMDARERADAFVETRLSAHYGEMGLGEALFFLCWATGVATWISGFIWLVKYLIGRFA